MRFEIVPISHLLLTALTEIISKPTEVPVGLIPLFQTMRAINLLGFPYARYGAGKSVIRTHHSGSVFPRLKVGDKETSHPCLLTHS